MKLPVGEGILAVGGDAFTGLEPITQPLVVLLNGCSTQTRALGDELVKELLLCGEPILTLIGEEDSIVFTLFRLLFLLSPLFFLPVLLPGFVVLQQAQIQRGVQAFWLRIGCEEVLEKGPESHDSFILLGVGVQVVHVVFCVRENLTEVLR